MHYNAFCIDLQGWANSIDTLHEINRVVCLGHTTWETPWNQKTTLNSSFSNGWSVLRGRTCPCGASFFLAMTSQSIQMLIIFNGKGWEKKKRNAKDETSKRFRACMHGWMVTCSSASCMVVGCHACHGFPSSKHHHHDGHRDHVLIISCHATPRLRTHPTKSGSAIVSNTIFDPL